MIYLDYNATTPIASAVLEAMMPYLKDEWGNAASSYRFGSKLKSVIEDAREKVADLLGAHPLEILFTSCGTESNNAAINAALLAHPGKKHIITCVTEHSSVLSHCRALEMRGYRVTYLPVDHEGLINLFDLEADITEETALVSIMWANNETGVLSPIENIGKLCRQKGVLYHCDAVQVAGKLPINLKHLPIDYLTITGHKITAPKGVGALFIRKTVPFSPYLYGGHQERERRGGTEAIPLIVGLASAAQITKRKLPTYSTKVTSLRDSFESTILSTVASAKRNGDPQKRLPNTSSITFRGIEAEAFLLLLDQQGICASSGSACLSDSPDPSNVIAAMTRDNSAARQTLRFSLDATTTPKELETTAECIQSIVQKLKPS